MTSPTHSLRHSLLHAAALASLFGAALAVAGCSKPPEAVVVPAAPAVATVDDVDVTTKVKTALQGNPALAGFDIAVVTTKGDVRLTGQVDTQTQIDDALRLARAADGVHAVHDELTLKKTP